MLSPTPPDGVRITYSRQYRRCGKPGCSRCTAGGPGHGPYWYAFWRDAGRTYSRYLGKQAPAEAVTRRAPRRRAFAAATAHGGRPRPAAAGTHAGRLRRLARGRAIPPAAWTSQRAATLFKCLLSTPGHRLPREQASELLWPEAEPAASATNLRTTMHLLRQILDGPGAAESHLHTEGGMLVLAPDGEYPSADWLDATAFARAAQAALAGPRSSAARRWPGMGATTCPMIPMRTGRCRRAPRCTSCTWSAAAPADPERRWG